MEQICHAWVKSRGAGQTPLQVEHGHHKANAVFNGFSKHREIVGLVGHDLANDLTVFEPEVGLVLARDCLHLRVFGETAHVQPLQTAIAGGNAHDWDLAAADLLVHEAGGLMTSLDGRPLVYNRPDPIHSLLLAAGHERHEALIELVRAQASEPA